MNEISGKYAVITGGASGIGKSITRLFASEGAGGLLIVDIDEESAAELADEIQSSYDTEVSYKIIDLAQCEDIKELLFFIRTNIERVDIVVNCAGTCSVKDFTDTTETDWNNTMNVNLRSMFAICKGIIPLMKENNEGRIINISSISGRVGGIATSIDYSVSKGAIITFTKSLAKLVGSANINVNAVAPGYIQTEMTKDFSHFEVDSIPLGRLGQPEDVSEVVLFLSSRRSSYITGCTIDVNGGIYMN